MKTFRVLSMALATILVVTISCEKDLNTPVNNPAIQQVEQAQKERETQQVASQQQESKEQTALEDNGNSYENDLVESNQGESQDTEAGIAPGIVVITPAVPAVVGLVGVVGHAEKDLGVLARVPVFNNDGDVIFPGLHFSSHHQDLFHLHLFTTLLPHTWKEEQVHFAV